MSIWSFNHGESILDYDKTDNSSNPHNPNADCGVFGGWPYLAYGFLERLGGVEPEVLLARMCHYLRCMLHNPHRLTTPTAVVPVTAIPAWRRASTVPSVVRLPLTATSLSPVTPSWIRHSLWRDLPSLAMLPFQRCVEFHLFIEYFMRPLSNALWLIRTKLKWLFNL